MKLNKKEFFIKENKIYKIIKLLRGYQIIQDSFFLLETQGHGFVMEENTQFKRWIYRATNEWVNDQKNFLALKKRLNRNQFINIYYVDLIKQANNIKKNFKVSEY